MKAAVLRHPLNYSFPPCAHAHTQTHTRWRGRKLEQTEERERCSLYRSLPPPPTSLREVELEGRREGDGERGLL